MWQRGRSVQWTLAFVLIVIGLVGTILPGLPGPLAVYCGLLLAAWADGFTRIGSATLILLTLLTITALVVDVAAAALGVRPGPVPAGALPSEPLSERWSGCSRGFLAC